MKKLIIRIAAILGILIIGFSIIAFSIQDKSPNYLQEDITNFEGINLRDIKGEYDKIGMFKSSVELLYPAQKNEPYAYLGQEIHIHNNPNVDKIKVGITSNLISRIEIWNKKNLIDTKEQGFVGKMSWGSPHTLSVNFYDESNYKYKGKSKVQLRLYKGSGFFGDVASIHLDLTDYGNLEGAKKINLFADIENQSAPEHYFSNLNIWKNYASFD